MREYETTFIVQPEISDEGCAEIAAKLDGVLEKHGARRVMLDDWGKRKLAYDIQKFQKGHYFVLSYLDDGRASLDLERTLRLEESVLRFLTVKVDDDVTDADARVSEGQERERIQREKAAERAAREAEAEKAREQEAAAQARAEAESAAQAEADAAARTEAASEKAREEQGASETAAEAPEPSPEAPEGAAPQEPAKEKE